ncbi:high-affinity iron transporter [Metschnikowia aff. pulcherrima]|uniref:High-affinity iron transporter n=1 Tax=Metschnikowia aff. pulcherrima TaxID=2163413 RepID=A0A4P6XLA4_9ASCO|nr:high-affinity iron transporter [Metschnikowia aff. pulcherrima]
MFDMARYFSIQIFFIILRETLETAIIILVLLSFIKKREPENDSENAEHIRKINSGLRLQIWLGAICGLLICFAIGLVFVLCFYFIDTNLWSYTERLWEGLFCLLSSVIITVMGVGLLRINKVMKIKWWIKLGDAYQNDQPQDKLDPAEGDDGSTTALLAPERKKAAKEKFSKKYFLAILPFVTTLREGLEAVVFMGGIGMSQPLSSLPLAVLAGVLLGSGIGISLYKGGNKLSLQYFLICSTCFLYVVSAGLLSRGVWFLELEKYVRLCGGLDVSETGSGPGSYDIANTIWHVNCCNGLRDGWWMVANAIVGWTNTATYGSVFSYIGYWLFVSAWLRLRMSEERNGYLPFIPIKWQLKRIRKKIRMYEMRREHTLGSEAERAAEAQVLEG